MDPFDIPTVHRELLAAFCFNLNGLFAHVSLKNQLILNYAHLQRILEGFPAIRYARES